MLGPDVLNARILIVDDYEPDIKTLKNILVETGYRSIAVTQNPLEVRYLHQKNHYDLILLALQLPVLDGFGVISGLRMDALDGQLPVIALTNKASQKRRALQAGARDFISKPFDVMEVKTRIFNLLELRLLYQQLERYNYFMEETFFERTAELRASEARYRSLTALAADWFWEQDRNGDIVNVSGPVLEILGLLPEDNFADNILGGWNPEEQQTLQASVKARRPFLDFLISRIRDDGSVQYFRVSGEPIFDKACRFIGYRGLGVECLTQRNANKYNVQ